MNHAHHQRGFSFLDALMAVAVFSVSLLGLGKFQAVTFKEAANSKAKTEALNIAQAQIENLRAFDRLTGTLDDYEDIMTETSSVVGNNITFTMQSTVTSQGSPARKNIDVTIVWDILGHNESISLSSVIAASDPFVSGQLLLGAATSNVSISVSDTTVSESSSGDELDCSPSESGSDDGTSCVN